MPNKHTIRGKYNEVVGKMTDDKGRELKGKAEHKYGSMKDKAHHKIAHMKDEAPDLPDTDMDMDVMEDRKSTRLNSSHVAISYAVFCLKKKTRFNTEVIS